MTNWNRFQKLDAKLTRYEEGRGHPLTEREDRQYFALLATYDARRS